MSGIEIQEDNRYLLILLIYFSLSAMPFKPTVGILYSIYLFIQP